MPSLVRLRLRAPALALIPLALAGAAARAEGDAALRLELNRLETAGDACRAYLVVGNGGAEPLASLKLDLVMFGTDGVIDRRLAVETGPLRAQKTTVKLFDLAGTPCERLGSVLVNDVLDCRTEAMALDGCFERLELSSRAAVGLVR